MEYGYSSSKSPMKLMFSSVFRREDIKLSKDSRSISTVRSDYNSQNISRDYTPVKSSLLVTEDLQRNSRFTTPENTIKKSTGIFKYSDHNVATHKAANSLIPKEETFQENRYEDLLKKYDRMQEFYKSQIICLNEEVDHYKKLYQKLLNHPISERKY